MFEYIPGDKLAILRKIIPFLLVMLQARELCTI